MRSICYRMISLGVLCLVLATVSFADTQIFPPETEVAGKKLFLNGTGFRTATIFGIKVYHAALYVEKKSTDPDEILNSSANKQMRMYFVHDVDVGKIRNGFHDSFKDNCAPDCDKLLPYATQLEALMGDVKSGDEIDFDFNPTWIIYRYRGKDIGTLKGPGYARVLLATWLGPKPPSQELKNGLLGKSPH